MKSVNGPVVASIADLLDGVRMSEQDRDIAKAYVHMTEAALDLIWVVGAGVRAAVGRVTGAAPTARQGARA